MTKLVCEECGGTNIQTKAWVDPNGNGDYIDLMEGDDDDDNWCDDCQDHLGFKEIKGDDD